MMIMYDIKVIAQLHDEKTHISTILHEHFDSAASHERTRNNSTRCETTNTKNQREEISSARWNEAGYLKNIGNRRTVHTRFDM